MTRKERLGLSKDILFTQEVKSAWLEALKSGNYVQGQMSLVVEKEDLKNKSGKIEHCCLGVLGDIHNELGNDFSDLTSYDLFDAYDVRQGNKSEKTKHAIWKANDDRKYWVQPNCPQDYSNVIPIIEKLEVEKEVKK